MGSRKDIIKRHLGITEYPWSSDDELEEAPPGAEEATLRRPTTEAHHTMTEAPGASGVPPQQVPQQQHLQEQQQQMQHHQNAQLQEQQQQQQLHRLQNQQLQDQQQQLHLQQQHQEQQQQLQRQQQLMEQQEGAARRLQARLDRNVYWSIVNHSRFPPQRLSDSQGSRMRSSDNPMYTSRVNHVPAPELRERSGEQPAANDIQRMLAFKRLTRRLNTLHQRGHISGVIPLSRLNPGVLVPSEANARNGRHVPIRRYVRISPYGPIPAGASHQMTFPLEAMPSGAIPPGAMPSEPGPSGQQRSRPRHATPDDERPPVPLPPIPVPSSEDEVNNNPLPAAEDVAASDEDNTELDTQLEDEIDGEAAPANDNSPSASYAGSNMANADETLDDEMDGENFENSQDAAQASAPDEEEETEPPPVAPPSASAPDLNRPSGLKVFLSGEYRIPDSDPNMASTSNAAVANDAEQTSHGKKRKRRNSEELPEPYSVTEFNQNLLRLLECPVCLEWMEPPMSQCRRGHLVCGRCRARLASCPVCRTTFSSVRNRAMEGVAEMLRYPCRHGCGREVRLRRRATHEASCGSRKYNCPAPQCAAAAPLPREQLALHFQKLHLTMLRIGRRHKFSMKVNTEQHDNWLILAMGEYFHLRIDVDIRTWGVIVYVSYIGPKCDANYFTYEVTVDGRHNQRKLVYARTTHSDLESSSLNVCRQDCFHLTLDQALNFIRFKNRHCDSDKFLDFHVEISKVEARDESES